jgi:hypothetical protein
MVTLKAKLKWVTLRGNSRTGREKQSQRPHPEGRVKRAPRGDDMKIEVSPQPSRYILRETWAPKTKSF